MTLISLVDLVEPSQHSHDCLLCEELFGSAMVNSKYISVLLIS